jgi:hypothetical protein
MKVDNRLTALRLMRLKPNDPQSTCALAILPSVRDDLVGWAGNVYLQAPGGTPSWIRALSAQRVGRSFLSGSQVLLFSWSFGPILSKMV